MKQTRLIWTLITIILLSVVVSSTSQDEYTNGLTIENLTYTDNQTYTRYIKIPHAVNVNLAQINVYPYLYAETNFSDYFNRADSGTVGNGWNEVEPGTSDVSIIDGNLTFDKTAGDSDFAYVHRDWLNYTYIFNESLVKSNMSQVFLQYDINLTGSQVTDNQRVNLVVFGNNTGTGKQGITIHMALGLELSVWFDSILVKQSYDYNFPQDNSTIIRHKVYITQNNISIKAYDRTTAEPTTYNLFKDYSSFETNSSFGDKLLFVDNSSVARGGFFKVDNIILDYNYRPKNFKLQVGEIDNTYEYNLTGFLNTSTELNFTKSVRDTYEDCTCTDCTLTSQYCTFPLFFSSDSKGIIETSNININYSEATLTECTSGNISVNYTVKDEDTLERITADITGTYNYEVGDVSDSLDIDITNQNNFSICLDPGWVTITGDYELFYEADGFPQRRYNDDSFIFTSATQLINLYLLDDAVYITYVVSDSYSNLIDDVLVTMSANINGSIVVVESQTTDDFGVATFAADLNTDYTFLFSKTGYETQTYEHRPTASATIGITMSQESGGTNLSYSSGVSVRMLPDNTILNNFTVYDFSFILDSDYYDITGCNLTIYANDTIQLNSTVPSYTTTYCNAPVLDINTANYTYITATGYYELNSTVNRTYSITYRVIYTYQGSGSLRNFLDSVSNFSHAGFNDFSRMIIALLAIILIMYSLSYGVIGDINPEKSMVLFTLLLWLFSYLGWFTIHNERIPFDGLQQYIIVILLSLGTIAFIIKRNT